MIANIIDIIKGTTVDGPGFRTSIYFAGCRHNCPGCHNPESWDFSAGNPTSIDDLIGIIEEEDFDVTLSGGDPLYNPSFVAELTERVHRLKHTVWLYTGFLWEDIMIDADIREAIRNVDVIVDSPFIIDLRDTDLLFRGSSNQRIIDVKASLEKPDYTPVLWHR